MRNVALRGVVVAFASLGVGCFSSSQPEGREDEGRFGDSAQAAEQTAGSGVANAGGSSAEPTAGAGAQPAASGASAESAQEGASAGSAGGAADEPASGASGGAGTEFSSSVTEPAPGSASCPAIEQLRPSADGGGAFAHCEEDGECDVDQGCYGREDVGFCQGQNANDEGSPCVPGEVRLQAREPRWGVWAEGLCMWPGWRDYLCCNWPEHFECEASGGDTPPDLGSYGCEIVSEAVYASDLSPTDGCSLELECAFGRLVVECDGENDGTWTSGCACTHGGVQRVNGIFDGEGVPACGRAAIACVRAVAGD